MSTPRWEGRLLVVGTGLIGTSVGLAARAAGAEVLLTDRDAERAAFAASLGAGEAVADRAFDPDAPVSLVLVATPPAAVPPAVTAALRHKLGATVTHVASVQAGPRREIELLGAPMRRFVGSHPIAGRERTGPAHADADLFRDRPWIVCATPATEPSAAAAVAEFAGALGARPVHMADEDHDRVFAALSHAPQLVASALAAGLLRTPSAEVELAGAGLRDTTRLADSDPDLWAEIVSANREAVAAALRAVLIPLSALADTLETDPDPSPAVRALVSDGRAGRALLPGKHGGRPVRLTSALVAVPDAPGSLARLLAAVADLGVNLEDLRVEHAPGKPAGVAELIVVPDVLPGLVEALRTAGWTVTSDA